MSENNRQYPRQNIKVEVELCFLDDCTEKAVTRDISRGGAFLLLQNPQKFPMGEMITLSYTDPLNDNNPTTKDAIVVRHADDGIAVAYIEMEEF
ncbi:MAG TPA: PilZ domain-containing protein [Gammaproteobacteria bacterium]|nr:PilZ domain-containing protein [Gammaproteobacteria bacterium]